MSILKTFYVKRVFRKDISEFIEKYHYSKNINGCMTDYCYALFNAFGDMKGALFFGKMAMANQWRRFSDSEDNVIELRRLVCVDDTPKNAESYFISRALKLLAKDWKKGLVVSYSDLEYGHTGVIYKASNFKFLGFKKGSKVIVYNGKRYHDKSIRSKNNGVLKPYAIRLIEALENGEAYYVKTKGKNTYIYQL